mmetsp:Transcript_59823/g.146918  ORF Transcript_59823/g.146918 Transcript_59823/m.146918 type:complete len:300 (+) Transcript_59823:84-983(+)
MVDCIDRLFVPYTGPVSSNQKNTHARSNIIYRRITSTTTKQKMKMMEQFQAQTNDSRNGRQPSRHNLLRKRRRCRRSATTTAISDKTTPPATTTTTTRSKMILLLLVATAAATVLTSPKIVDALPPSFGTSHHHSHAPIELDVESPLLIDLDSTERSSCEDYHASLLESGYAGTIDAVGRNFYVAEYGYQMILNSSLVEENDLVVSTARTTAAGRNNDGGSVSSSNSITFHQPKSFGEVDENSLQNIVFQIEFEIASYMLKESSAFDNAPCNTNNDNNNNRDTATAAVTTTAVSTWHSS